MKLNSNGPYEKNPHLSLSTNLFDKLRIDIVQGNLKPGEKLTEQQICARYGVSRTPVREAFKQLEPEGLISIIPNRGAFVVGLSPQDVRDIFELRKAYEILAVKWGITRMSEEEVSELEEAFDFMEFYTQKKDICKMLNINTNFHRLIYDGAKNKMLSHALYSYQLYIKQLRVTAPHTPAYLDVILEEHRAIFQAFKSRDTNAGVEAMTLHMDNSICRLG